MKKIRAFAIMEYVEDYKAIQNLISFKDMNFSCLLMLCLYSVLCLLENHSHIKAKNFDKFEYYFYVWRSAETFIEFFDYGVFCNTNTLYIETLDNNEYIIKIKVTNENNTIYCYLSIIRNDKLYFIKLKECEGLTWYKNTYGDENKKYIKKYIKELEVVDTTIPCNDLDVKKFKDLFPILDEMYDKGEL